MTRLRLPGGVEAVIAVRGADTDGAFALITDSAPPGWALPPHRHQHESETIHVTSGRLWMNVDGTAQELGPGDTIHIPAGVRHEGGTLGTAPVERVVVFAPAGMEEFFDVLAATEDQAELPALARRYGWDFS